MNVKPKNRKAGSNTSYSLNLFSITVRPDEALHRAAKIHTNSISITTLNKAEIIMMVIRISETTVINLFVLNLLLSDSKINNQFINL